MVVVGGNVDGGAFVVVVGGASVVVVGASVVVSGHLSGKDKQQSGSRSLKIQQQRGRMCSLATLYVLVLC